MNSSNVTQPTSLSEHLLNFGRHFEHCSDVNGAPEYLPAQERLKRWTQPRGPQQVDESKPDNSRGLDQWHAGTRLVTAAPLDKADALRVVGDYVTGQLEGTRILDIGCGIGYLSSWYAACRPAARVFGIDLSASNIMLARRFAAARHIRNLQLAVCDARHYVPDEAFDTIIDTQGLVGPEIGPADIRRMLSWLKPGGKFICAPALETLDQFVAFLDKLESAMCHISSLKWLAFSVGNGRGVYPAMIIAPDASE
ncbi:MAG: class I SAM-dependent methyltransferase [Zoogloeaceae bacterium]|nr:class I SAM-dependent methyltransferase [Rhodocyclaceae bacterium]MCP5234116.1 class I SAM-dependent methyltransferase [Zoogloeaceae bacterium]